MNNVEAWIIEALRRGEKITVFLRNETTKEEVETSINPMFAALASTGVIKLPPLAEEN